MSEKSTREVMREATAEASANIEVAVDRFLSWLASPEGKAACASAKKRGDETRKLFKQRQFTAEELNQRYQPSLNGSPSTSSGVRDE